MTVDLPHWRGPGECLHLMSFISPVADRLAVVYLPLMSVPFVQELQRRGWSFIEVPDEEFETHGCNVLALAPMRVLVCDGSPVTRARLEAAGCDVLAYTGDEISHNRAGGPTCLTRPILRAADTTTGASDRFLTRTVATVTVRATPYRTGRRAGPEWNRSRSRLDVEPRVATCV